MSSYDDELSETSVDEFTATGKEEPPTLDETLFDISLFTMFMNYMKNQQAGAELMFIKQARLLRMFNVPPAVFAQHAIKMIWTFFSECAKMPVRVSHDVKKKLQEISLDPEKEATLNRDTFSMAFAEVYNAVGPLFYDWLATNEWQEAIPFHRLPPPSFNIVLTSNTLRIIFNKYLNTQLENDSDGSLSHAYHLWKFCIVANDFRDGKCNHLLDSKKAKHSKKDGAASEASSRSESSATDKEAPNPEEYAKRVHKKYNHHISLQYDGSTTYSSYLLAALNQSIDEFDKSPVFANWLKLKQYQGVDFQAKTVRQSLTPEGYAEPPTFAGVLTSSMLKFFLVMLAGRESGLNVEFIIEILKFRDTFDPEKSASSTEHSHKEMVEEARRIFTKYLETGAMYCDPLLVDEVRNIISKNGGKAVNPAMFRKIGAFIYHRSEHSWGRQARATIVWANKSYDNHSPAAQEIEKEFSLSLLPEGINLQVVPTVDDMLACRDLARDYRDFIGKEVFDPFMKFHDAYEEYFRATPENRKPLLDKVAKAYGEVTVQFPKLKPIHHLLLKEIGRRKSLADSVFSFLSASIVRATTKKFYSKWLVEHANVWKTTPWTPVTNIVFSDMNSVYGMSSVERKIEEAALKGKTGLSRYFAKRAIKKQAVANLRSSPSKTTPEVTSPSFAGDASTMLSFATPRPEARDSIPIPTIMETLSSAYLRKYFEENFLITHMQAKELTLWNQLCQFYLKYSTMDDDKMDEAQGEMKKEIEQICNKNLGLLKNGSAIIQRAKSQKAVYPQFFRSYEMELFGKYHEEYVKFLTAKGWK